MNKKEHRLSELLLNLKLNPKEFAESIGLKRADRIYFVLNGRNDISTDLARVINDKYPNVNSDWLLTGKGEMLIADKEEPTEKEAEEPKTDEAKQNDSSENEEPKISFTSGVPYYNVDFIGGFDLVMNDQTINPEYLIDFKKYNDATCWCNVTGHSMEPEITHGDMIALKEIKDMSFLPFGEVYAIVTTNEMRTIKRLGKGDDKDHYNLIPTNKSQEYAIQELPKRMISAIFQVLGCMKRL